MVNLDPDPIWNLQFGLGDFNGDNGFGSPNSPNPNVCIGWILVDLMDNTFCNSHIEICERGGGEHGCGPSSAPKSKFAFPNSHSQRGLGSFD